MIKRLYGWLLSLAARKSAKYWLAMVAFAESAFFPLPSDLIFLPMAFATPRKAYRIAAIASIFSILGGLMGYGLGLLAFDLIAKPALLAFGKLAEFEHLKSCLGTHSVIAMIPTSAFAHFPPSLMVTVLAGAVQLGLLTFALTFVVARTARYFVIAWALCRWGEPIREFIERRLALMAGLIAAIVIGLYAAVKLLGHSGSMGC